MGKILDSKPIIPNKKAIPIREKATGKPAKRHKSIAGNIKRGKYSDPIILIL